MFHRLRVINFSKSCISDGTNINKPEKPPERKSSVKIKISSKIEQPASLKEIRKQTHGVTYKNIGKDNKCECRASSPINLTIHKKSLSETLTCACPSNECNLKNLSQRKTMSLNDVKEKMITKRHQYCKNIKLVFQSLKKDVTMKRAGQKIKRKPEDMKVAFVCSPKDPQQSTSARNKLTCRRKRKISDATTSYSDIFGFCRKKRFNPYFLYQRCKNDENLFKKLKKRSTVKRSNINEFSRTSMRHQPLKVVSSGLEFSSSSFCSSRLHYNLVGFPRNRRQSKESEQIVSIHEAPIDNKVLISNRCCNEPPQETKNTCVSAPKLDAGRTDAACTTQKTVVLNPPDQKTRKKRKIPKCKKYPKKNVSFKRRKPSCNDASFKKSSVMPIIRKFQVISEKFHQRRDIRGRTVLKYAVMVIVAIAWSPCVLAIACGWLLTYPLRPQQVITEEKDPCQEECSSYYNNNNSSFWALMVGNVKTAYNKTVSTGSAIKSMLVPDIGRKAKSQQMNSSPTLINSGPTGLPKHPNPHKRYTLGYKDERGWVMKPVRQRTNVRTQNRARFSVFNQTMQKFLCGCGLNSSATACDKHEADIFTYSATEKRKPNRTDGSQKKLKSSSLQKQSAKIKSKNLSKPNFASIDDSQKNIKSSSTQKLFVKAKSKHFELKSKPQLNRFDTQSHVYACSKSCLHRYKKNYTDKKTGDEGMSDQLPPKKKKVDKDAQSPISERSNCSLGSLKLSDQSRHTADNAHRRSRSSTEQSKLHQPIKRSSSKKKPRKSNLSPATQTKGRKSSIYRKSHSGESPVSSSSDSQRHVRHRDANIKRRSQRIRKPDQSGKIILPERSTSEMSVRHAEYAHRVPKRSRSESARGPCRRKYSSCRICSKNRRYSGHFERDAYRCYEPLRHRSCHLQRRRSNYNTLSQYNTEVSSKKQPLKKDPSRSPAKKEHIDIKIKRKKKKKKPKPNADKTEKNRTCNSPKQVILIQKIRKIPVKRKKKKRKKICRRVARYFGANFLRRLDKKIHSAMFPMHLNCRNLHLYTLKNKPCFWVYCWCPDCYPSFLGLYNCFMACFKSCMTCISLIFWSPLILSCYACYLSCCQVCCAN